MNDRYETDWEQVRNRRRREEPPLKPLARLHRPSRGS